jgi:PAS domain S-box-containing protein
MSQTAIKLLLVEDNTAEAALLKAELAESPFGPFEVHRAKRLADAIIQLQAEKFDVVLLDLGLPDSQGLATLLEINNHKPRELPIVVLTGFHDEALGVRALQEGAADYLVKGGTSDSMRARSVRYAIERKRAGEAVLASEQRLALAVEATRLGIFDWNFVTGKVSRSHHHKMLFGLDPQEMEDTFEGFERCVHPNDRAGVKARVQSAIAAREAYRHEFRTIWPDGSEHWVEARGKIFYDDHDKPISMLGTVMDITTRKAAEISAKLRDAELAHLSRVTTMGQMASGLAHELNQPLAAILNYAKVCAGHLESNDGSAATARTAIEEVMNETRRAGAIITRMRSFVRKQLPVSIPVDINKLVRDSVNLMEFELRHQRIIPRFELAGSLPKVRADTVQLEQVLVNLILNALESMAENRSSENGLTLQTMLQHDHSVQVSIIDTGAGMSPQALARLFEPFFTTKEKGLGMGLNISRTIIESHGGRLTATANPAGGMRFSFTLPTLSGGM